MTHPEDFSSPFDESLLVEEISAHLASEFDPPVLSPEEIAEEENKARNYATVRPMLASNGLVIDLPEGQDFMGGYLDTCRRIDALRTTYDTQLYGHLARDGDDSAMTQQYKDFRRRAAKLTKQGDLLMLADNIVDAVPTGDRSIDEFTTDDTLVKILTNLNIQPTEKASLLQTLREVVGSQAYAESTARVTIDGTLDDGQHQELELFYGEDTTAETVATCLMELRALGPVHHDDWPVFVSQLERAVRKKAADMPSLVIDHSIDQLTKKAAVIGLPPAKLAAILQKLNII